MLVPGGKMKKILVAWMVVLTGCQQQIEQKAEGAPEVTTPAAVVLADTVAGQTKKVITAPAQGEETDYCTEYSVMDADSLQYNGIGFETALEVFLLKMGQPDSIVDNADACGYFAAEGVPLKEYHYRAISFRVYEGKAEMKEIDFTGSAVELTYPGLTLSGQTTLEDIKMHFPVSYASAYALQDTTVAKQYTFVRLLPKAGVDDQIVLKFLEGKLVALEVWLPC